MRVALCQLEAAVSPAVNLEAVRSHVARSAGADLVVFPEATLTRFGGDMAAYAEPLDGPWVSAVREIAGAAGTCVITGTFTPAGPRIHNTLVAASRSGVVGYDKIHLFDAYGYRESERIAPGSDPVCVDVGGVAVGLSTCYDVRFPELYVALARAGASVLVAAAAWQAGPGKVEQWELLVRARAVDTGSWVVAVGSAAGETDFGVGHSMVIAPDGAVVDRLGGEPGLLLVDLDPAAALTQREQVPVLTNRRL
jgi:predicted amidohydrolase